VNEGDIVAKGNFRKQKEVSAEFEIEEGMSYVVIPCLFRPRDEGTYTFFVYSSLVDSVSFSYIEENDVKVAVGEWTTETAGGCINFPTWINNPHIALHVEKKVQMMIMLVQQGNDPEKIAQDTWEAIGCYVTKGDKWGFPEIDSPEDIITKTSFEPSADISIELSIGPPVNGNPFIITPCSFEPGYTSTFYLRIFASDEDKKYIRVEEIDYTAYVEMLEEGEKDDGIGRPPDDKEEKRDTEKEQEEKEKLERARQEKEAIEAKERELRDKEQKVPAEEQGTGKESEDKEKGPPSASAVSEKEDKEKAEKEERERKQREELSKRGAEQPEKEPATTPEAVKEPEKTPEAVKEPEKTPEAVKEPEKMPEAVKEPEKKEEKPVLPEDIKCPHCGVMFELLTLRILEESLPQVPAPPPIPPPPTAAPILEPPPAPPVLKPIQTAKEKRTAGLQASLGEKDKKAVTGKQDFLKELLAKGGGGLKSAALRKSAPPPKQQVWAFNMEKITARRASIECSDDEEEDEWNEWS